MCDVFAHSENMLTLHFPLLGRGAVGSWKFLEEVGLWASGCSGLDPTFICFFLSFTSPGNGGTWPVTFIPFSILVFHFLIIYPSSIYHLYIYHLYICLSSMYVSSIIFISIIYVCIIYLSICIIYVYMYLSPNHLSYLYLSYHLCMYVSSVYLSNVGTFLFPFTSHWFVRYPLMVLHSKMKRSQGKTRWESWPSFRGPLPHKRHI